jgi:hypothetical protein
LSRTERTIRMKRALFLLTTMALALVALEGRRKKCDHRYPARPRTPSLVPYRSGSGLWWRKW